MLILVLGKSGMLGSSILREYKDLSYRIIGWGREDLDITNREEVLQKITEIQPHAVINAAGLTNVDLCEQDPAQAQQINGEAAGHIAEACQIANAKLVHISTDYVFDGQNPEGYPEDYPTAPINEYGKSKLLAEQLVTEKCPRHHIIRVSWLFGINRQDTPSRKDFITNIIEWSKAKAELPILKGQIGKVTFVDDVAKTINHFILSEEYGIYHLCNEGELTRYDFAAETFKILNIPTKAKPATLEELNINWQAKRPQYSSLINTKLPELRTWQEALTDYLHKEYQEYADN